MLFNLSSLLSTTVSLNELEAPFSKQVINLVVSDLPNNKSPRTNGFNNEFIKICWTLIAQYFCRLYEDFYEANHYMEA